MRTISKVLLFKKKSVKGNKKQEIAKLGMKDEAKHVQTLRIPQQQPVLSEICEFHPSVSFKFAGEALHLDYHWQRNFYAKHKRFTTQNHSVDDTAGICH